MENIDRSFVVKLSIAGVALIAAGVLFWRMREPPVLPPSTTFICVETGEHFTISRDDMSSFLPARNPKTDKATLVPVETEDGQEYINRRFAHLLKKLEEVNQYVDPQTLAVKPTP